VINEMLLVMFGLLLAFNVGHFFTLKECKNALLRISMDAKQVSEFNPNDLLDEVSNEISGVVHELVSNMRTPTVADHLGGVISQFAQMRMMKMMQSEGMLPDALQEAIESND
jgi:hypothetical protein